MGNKKCEAKIARQKNVKPGSGKRRLRRMSRWPDASATMRKKPVQSSRLLVEAELEAKHGYRMRSE